MPIEVPIDALQPATLRRVIEEFVSREGTDYGHHEFDLAQKVAHVMTQLRQRRAQLMFDEQTESFTICGSVRLSKGSEG